MYDSNEKRETTRLDIEASVIISDKAQNKISGTIQNLSANGALIKTNGQLKSGIPYWISIELQGASSSLTINNLKGTVARHDGDCVAIAFSDSMEWLTLFYIYKQKLKLDQPPKDKTTSKKMITIS